MADFTLSTLIMTLAGRRAARRTAAKRAGTRPIDAYLMPIDLADTRQGLRRHDMPAELPRQRWAA